MNRFLQCEFFGFLKLIGLLVIINFTIKILGKISYSQEVFVGSVVTFGMYTIWFIIKFVLVLVRNSALEYECKQGEWFGDLLQIFARFF